MTEATLPVHYLSATIVETDKGKRHLAFCGVQIIYGLDPRWYQVANYSDPTRVTCNGCLTAYAGTYPQAYAQWRERFPEPVEYVRQAGEHPDVSALRDMQAEAHYAWLKRYINDPSVTPTALMHTLHKLTYEAAKELAAMAIRLHESREGE